ncbi:hypothetical protein CSOJ01_14182 [Colletotrichum sojae]|uniref:Uncharacterized protein n=1 Tax=Colletotrichum sojae TaxID=2175907 RepID=A0A8H6IR95_9PEZI|nr:hypothetical protein CSOJ01_14182 [Colletotrichum sojae]
MRPASRRTRYAQLIDLYPKDFKDTLRAVEGIIPPEDEPDVCLMHAGGTAKRNGKTMPMSSASDAFGNVEKALCPQITITC